MNIFSYDELKSKASREINRLATSTRLPMTLLLDIDLLNIEMIVNSNDAFQDAHKTTMQLCFLGVVHSTQAKSDVLGF
ncbi:MAG TPA: hypothetical protein VHZ76_03425 [Gammaproteobacteria bacterium]|jgi:hypothetical protein|nr:hypothetical protein [Gammaproteobacteria bacterium]